jgi:hypothetical protein
VICYIEVPLKAGLTAVNLIYPRTTTGLTVYHLQRYSFRNMSTSALINVLHFATCSFYRQVDVCLKSLQIVPLIQSLSSRFDQDDWNCDFVVSVKYHLRTNQFHVRDGECI